MSFSSAENFRTFRAMLNAACQQQGVDYATWAAGFEQGYALGMKSKTSIEGINMNLMYYIGDFINKVSSDIFDFSKINKFEHYRSMVLDAYSDRSLFVRGVLQLANNVSGSDGNVIQRNLSSILNNNVTEITPLQVNDMLMDARGVRSTKSNGITVNEEFVSQEEKQRLDMLYNLANEALTGGIAAGEVELFLFCVYWTVLTQVGPLDVQNKNRFDSGYLVDKTIVNDTIKALLVNSFANGTVIRVTNKFTPINKKPKDDLSSFHTFYVVNSDTPFTLLLTSAFKLSDKYAVRLNPNQISSHVSPEFAKGIVYGSSSVVKLINEAMMSMNFNPTPSPPSNLKSRFSADEQVNTSNLLFSMRLLLLVHSSFSDVVKSLNFFA